MSETKLIIGYDRYSYFISIFIDFVINVSKDEVKLKLNNNKRCYFNLYYIL
jgi:hypothetical protein